MTEDDIKVGQEWIYRGDGDVITIEGVEKHLLTGTFRHDGQTECTKGWLLRTCDLIKDVEDPVWTHKSDGYVPEIKYESDASIVYVDRLGKEEPAVMHQFKIFYEKRPRKTPEAISAMKSAAMLGELDVRS